MLMLSAKTALVTGMAAIVKDECISHIMRFNKSRNNSARLAMRGIETRIRERVGST
jgi:hypothetical protein